MSHYFTTASFLQKMRKTTKLHTDIMQNYTALMRTEIKFALQPTLYIFNTTFYLHDFSSFGDEATRVSEDMTFHYVQTLCKKRTNVTFPTKDNIYEILNNLLPTFFLNSDTNLKTFKII